MRHGLEKRSRARGLGSPRHRHGIARVNTPGTPGGLAGHRSGHARRGQEGTPRGWRQAGNSGDVGAQWACIIDEEEDVPCAI